MDERAGESQPVATREIREGVDPVRFPAARAFAGRTFDRARTNALGTAGLVRRRLARPAPPVALPWKPYLAAALLATLFAAVFLDLPLVSFLDEWPPQMRVIAEWATLAGLGGWYLIPAGMLLLASALIAWHGRPRRQLLLMVNWTGLAYFTLVAAGGSGILVNILKYAIGRLRPLHFEAAGAFAFQPFAMTASMASFPSGHATTVGAMAGVVILLAPRSRWVVIPLAAALAFTRIMVGAHYPSDVVAGLAFGFGFAVLSAVVFARLDMVFRNAGPGLPRRKPSFRLL